MSKDWNSLRTKWIEIDSRWRRNRAISWLLFKHFISCFIDYVKKITIRNVPSVKCFIIFSMRDQNVLSLIRKWNTYVLLRIFPPIGIFPSWPRYVKRERRNKKEKERAFKSTIISARQNRALSTCIFHCPQYKHETDRETKQEGVIKKRKVW